MSLFFVFNCCFLFALLELKLKFSIEKDVSFNVFIAVDINIYI